MDFLDIMEGKAERTFTAQYYDRLPRHPEEAAVSVIEGVTYKVIPNNPPMLFNYEHVDVTSYRYRQLIGNLIDTTSASAAIKSCDDVPFTVGKFVRLQDGKLYTIVSVTVDYNSASREASRLLPIPLGVESVLRLEERSDPWKIA